MRNNRERLLDMLEAIERIEKYRDPWGNSISTRRIDSELDGPETFRSLVKPPGRYLKTLETNIVTFRGPTSSACVT